MVQLAELMLDADELRAKCDQDELRAAQQERRQALEKEVAALHEAADDTRAGAWLEGGATALGGLATASSQLFGKFPKNATVPEGGWGVIMKSGEALERMSAPLGRLVGEAPSQDDQADAKQAEAEASDAQTRADAARQHLERIRTEQDRTIASVENIVESEAQGNWALIANV
jgi:hypothetical protein